VADSLVLFGGPSPEHDINVLTGLQAARALRTPEAIYWTRSGEFVLVDATLEAVAFADGVPRGAKPVTISTDGGIRVKARRERALDVVIVNCCHGGPGENGSLQALLDLAGIAYTGPSVSGAALGMDKLAFGAFADLARIPSLPRELLTDTTKPDFEGPYIVKPRFGGSSIGIDVVADISTAHERLRANAFLADGAVIEPFKAGSVDLNVAVRTFPSLQLSAIEKPTRSTKEIYTYLEKYAGGEGMLSAPRELPAVLDPSIEAKLRDFAERLAVLSNVRGVARIDFLLDGDALYLNEINTIPGSLARHLWVDPSVPFTELLNDMVLEATKRPTARYSAAGADGTVLRGAGAIASKLA
jgi:D-alanine-D-alanine ligase